MKITDLYGDIPIEPFAGRVVSRTIGVKADPIKVSTRAGRNLDEIVSINAVLSRTEVRTGEARQKIKWEKSNRRTRYSDGSVPVVYSSVDDETSIVERFHWAFDGIDEPEDYGPFYVRLEVLEIDFSGQIRDLTDKCPPCIELVHPNDYGSCIEIGRLAADDGVDGLLVPSARRTGGVNVPLFRGEHVGNVRNVKSVTVFADGFPESAMAHIEGKQFPAGREDVYSQVASTD